MSKQNKPSLFRILVALKEIMMTMIKEVLDNLKENILNTLTRCIK